MDFKELQAKATEQSDARAEAFRKGLASKRERESKETAEIQSLLAKVGERTEAAAKAAMEAKIEAEKENVKAEIRAKYAKEHGSAEWNDDRVAPLKNMLRGLL